MHLPEWVKTRITGIEKTQKFLKIRNLNTVCEALRCPNRRDCYRHKVLTFMILGRICTRGCLFCNSEKGKPEPPDSFEPERIARVVKELFLKYVVITSPARDDLSDGGAGHFTKTVEEIKKINPDSLIEVLVPDFQGNIESIKNVVSSEIAVFSHNMETVKKFYGSVRKADYRCSLKVIETAKNINPEIITKSGLMLGLGETIEEVFETLKDLKNAGCDIVTFGQYLQPSKKALPVVEYIKPTVFSMMAEKALQFGFKAVLSSPLVRSSTLAYDIYLAAKEGADGKL
uniref:Lipoyl synthase n=1 Tax=Thermodesulfovibrio aggregans TaxID=86166 RepID=A0A7C4AK45_9BACT